MCLNVQFVTNSQDRILLVSSGIGTTSNIGSAADFLGAVADGSNIGAVATYGDTSDHALVTQSNISHISQLKGKSFGYHTTVPVILLELFHAAGLNVSTVHERDTSN
jgi:hypothetical protein